MPRNCILSDICKSLGLWMISALWATGLFAQEPAKSLDQLKLLMEEGDKVTLVDSSGRKVTGRVDRLSPDGIDLVVSGHVKTFAEKDIQRITQNKSDSPLNGFLIGCGIGFGATLPFNLTYANNEGGDTGTAVAVSTLWGFIGGGIGALVDASIHKKQLVYLRKYRAVSWSISPLFSEPPQYSPPGARAFPAGSPFHSGIQSPKGVAINLRF